MAIRKNNNVKKVPPAKPAPADKTGCYTPKEVNELISLVHEKGFDEFELSQGGLHLRIVSRRATPAPIVTMSGPMPMMAAPAPVMAAPSHASALPAPVAEVPAPVTPAEDDSRFTPVKSPMVGTFYRSPAPTSPSFVKVGDRVDDNTVLCIVEAMKLMNEIKAETSGVVKKICVENAQPVEYGQVLFLIDPS